MSAQSSLSRRELFKAGGCLVVSFGLAELAGKLGVEEKVSAQAVGTLVGRPSRDVDGWISIGADGRVTDVGVVKSVHPLLDESARRAVLRYSYRPGTRNGSPEAARVRVTVSFRLQ